MAVPAAEDIFEDMLGAAEGAFAENWQAVVKYAPTEFRKMAIQLEDIARNVARYKADKSEGYSPKTAKILFEMQRGACESVLVATTHLTLLAVQKALDAIFEVLKKAFKTALAAVL